MTVNVTVDLAPPVARKAARRGLLQPRSISRLIEREIAGDQAARGFRRMVASIRSRSEEPMTMEEIQTEVEASRAERRARESRR